MDAGDRPGITGVELNAGERPKRMAVVTITDHLAPVTERGAYRVTVVFRHPTQAAGFDDEGLKSPRPAGDSGLRIPAGNVAMVFEEPAVEGGELRIALQANAKGNLAQATAELTVDGAPLARRLVTTHLGAILARLAFETDAPVAMHWIEVIALKTGQGETGLLYRGKDVALANWPDWKHHAQAFFRNAFSVYREGLITTDAYWAVFCFIRVIEGVRAYRAKEALVMKKRAMDLGRPRLVVEDDPMIVAPYRGWIGKSSSYVADQLKAQLRVPVAHGVLPDEPMQAADQVGVENRYWLARPIAQQLARTVLRDALEVRDALGLEPIPELDDTTFA
ncbi:MAG TPA: hypothetical protein DCK98_00115 [Chloroflexi bacterium]|nr:hypothetical protein [Chloroflexota bacterium]HAL28104.1 hypothetical protein [Chloroflexota bacterium]